MLDRAETIDPLDASPAHGAPERWAARVIHELGAPHTSIPERLQRMLEHLLGELDAGIGSVLLVDADSRMRIAASLGLPDWVVRDTCLEVGSGISGHVAATGECLLVRDVERDDRFRRRNRERYHTPSFVSAPLVIGRAVRGVINASNKIDRGFFDRRDLALLEQLGLQAARVLPWVELADWSAGGGVRGGTVQDV